MNRRSVQETQAGIENSWRLSQELRKQMDDLDRRLQEAKYNRMFQSAHQTNYFSLTTAPAPLPHSYRPAGDQIRRDLSERRELSPPRERRPDRQEFISAAAVKLPARREIPSNFEVEDYPVQQVMEPREVQLEDLQIFRRRLNQISEENRRIHDSVVSPTPNIRPASRSPVQLGVSVGTQAESISNRQSSSRTSTTSKRTSDSASLHSVGVQVGNVDKPSANLRRVRPFPRSSSQPRTAERPPLVEIVRKPPVPKQPRRSTVVSVPTTSAEPDMSEDKRRLLEERRRIGREHMIKRRQIERRSASNPPVPSRCHEVNRTYDAEAVRKYRDDQDKRRREKEAEELLLAAAEALKRRENLRRAERHQLERSKKSAARLLLEDRFAQQPSEPLNIERIQAYIQQTSAFQQEHQGSSRESQTPEGSAGAADAGQPQRDSQVTTPTGTSSLSSQSPPRQSPINLPQIEQSSPVRTVGVDEHNIINTIVRKYPQFSGLSQPEVLRGISHPPIPLELSRDVGDESRSDSLPLDTSISSHFDSSAPLSLSLSRKLSSIPPVNDITPRVTPVELFVDIDEFVTPKRSSRPVEGATERPSTSGRPDVVPETASNGKSPSDSSGSGGTEAVLQPTAMEDRVHAALDFLDSNETNLRRTENLKQQISAPIAVQRATDNSLARLQQDQLLLIEQIANATRFPVVTEKIPSTVDAATDPTAADRQEKSVEAKLPSETISPTKSVPKSSNSSAKLSSTDTSVSLPVQRESESSDATSSAPQSWSSEKREFGPKLTAEAKRMVGTTSLRNGKARKEAAQQHFFWLRRFIAAQIGILHLQKRQYKFSNEDLKEFEDEERQLARQLSEKKEELHRDLRSPDPDSQFLKRENEAAVKYKELTSRALETMEQLRSSQSYSTTFTSEKISTTRNIAVSPALGSSNLTTNQSVAEEIPEAMGRTALSESSAVSEELEEARESSGSTSAVSEDLVVTAKSESTVSTVKEKSSARSSEVADSSSSIEAPTDRRSTSKSSHSAVETTIPSAAQRKSSALRRSSFGREETPNLSFSSEASEMEARVAQLRMELNEKREVADKLKVEYRQRNRDRLVDYEQSVKKQIVLYDSFIKTTERRIASLESGSEMVRPATPPVIMSPRLSPRDRSSLEHSRPVSPSKLAVNSPRQTLVKVADKLKQKEDKSSSESSVETATKSDASVKTALEESSNQNTSTIPTQKSDKVITSVPSTDGGSTVGEELPEEILEVTEGEIPEDSASRQKSSVTEDWESSPTDVVEDDINQEKLDTHRSQIDSSLSESKGSWEPHGDSAVSTPRPDETSLKEQSENLTATISEHSERIYERLVEEAMNDILRETMTECVKQWMGPANPSTTVAKSVESDQKSVEFSDFIEQNLIQESLDTMLANVKPPVQPTCSAAEVVDLLSSHERDRELQRVLELARKSLGSDYLNRSDSFRSDDEGVNTPNTSPRFTLISPRSPTDKFLTVYKSPRKYPKRKTSAEEELEASIHGDVENEISQEWLDDDFGLSANRSSEPIAIQPAQRLSPRSPRITTDQFSLVPHKPEEIREIVDSAVELLVKQRRCGEPLASVRYTPGARDDRPVGDLMLSRQSDRHYREFLFDSTRDFLSTVYPDEEVEIEPRRPWEKPPMLQRRTTFARLVPPSLEELKRRAYDHIINPRRTTLKSRRITAGSRKPDEVDLLLTEELYEEELRWADFAQEEAAVKMRTADSIDQLLLTDALEVILSSVIRP